MGKKHVPKTDDVKTTISGSVSVRLQQRFYSMCETLELVPAYVIRDLVADWVIDSEKRIKNALKSNQSEDVPETENLATDKQKGFIRYLTRQLKLPQQKLEGITMKEASKMIEELKRADITQRHDDDEQQKLF